MVDGSERRARSRRAPARCRARDVALAVALLAGSPVLMPASAQDLNMVKTPDSPLTLKTRGSFFVGGTVVQQSAAQIGELAAPAPVGTNLSNSPDQVTVNQMYVEFMVPERGDKVPVIMLHGASLSGKTYDTTPDGRMGWFEYFVRQGHPVYVPDQVGRARSGFDQQVFNDVRKGVVDKAMQPSILRLADKYGAWTNFRFGPTPGEAFPDTQFPVEAAAELSKQGIPDLNQQYKHPNPTFKALADLAIKAKGAVLIGHSQGGRFPTEVALTDSSGLKGLVLVEPGNCSMPWGTSYSSEQIAKLAKLPILVVFGDHLSNPTGLAGPGWQTRFDDCQRFVDSINAAKGTAEMLYPPKLGIFGNTHMIMQDKNNLVIADLILKWMDTNVK